MAGYGKKGMGGNPMGKKGMASMEEDIFGPSEVEIEGPGDAEISMMFEGEEEEMGGEDSLMRALMDAGYDVSPDKVSKIVAILEGEEPGMAPEGVEMTDSGAEASMV